MYYLLQVTLVEQHSYNRTVIHQINVTVSRMNIAGFLRVKENSISLHIIAETRSFLKSGIFWPPSIDHRSLKQNKPPERSPRGTIISRMWCVLQEKGYEKSGRFPKDMHKFQSERL